MDDGLTAGLNEAQLQAVTTTHPRVLCIAGAGTGKTTVLTRRIAHLIDNGVSPSRILAVTFTRAAAAEMRERVDELLPEGQRSSPEIHTLHSWGAKILRQCAAMFGLEPTFTVYDEQDMADVRKMAEEMVGATTSKLRRDRAQAIEREYTSLLRRANALDFDQIERYTLQAIREFPHARRLWVEHYRHVLVDEYQDTNLAQHTIVESLYPPNLFVVGDPRQSIYGFRGAEPSTIVGLADRADFEVIQLTTNYRSDTAIVDCGNSLQAPRWEKMQPRDGAGPGIVKASVADPAGVVRELVEQYGAGNVAVLGRTWRDLRHAHANMAVPSTIYDRSTDPWDHEDGRALARLVRHAVHPYDDNLAMWTAVWLGMTWPEVKAHRAVAMRDGTSMMEYLAVHDVERMGALYGSYIGIQAFVGEMWPDHVAMQGLTVSGKLEELERRGLTTRLDRLRALVADIAERHCTRDGRWWVDEMTPMQRFERWWASRSIAQRLREAEAEDTVSLMTLHAAKGLEWDAVVLLGVNEGRMPQLRTDTDHDEERRLLYVGATRARHTLVASVIPWVDASRYIGSFPY